MARGRRRHAVETDELAATEQVMDLFATEALLALDRFERSFPAGDAAQPRETAARLAYWWRELRMDDEPLSSRPTDAQRILTAAAELALDPDNKRGVTIAAATAKANADGRFENRGILRTGIDDFRRDFENSYGGKVSVPHDNEWLGQSLTRLARASVLRDVVALGVKVRMGGPARQAADELVRQGQQLMDDRRYLAAQQAASIGGRRQFVADQARYMATYMTYAVGVDLTPTPTWVQVALKAPALGYLAIKSMESWGQRLDATDKGPAQARLESVRTALTDGLDGLSPLGQRDTRAINTARNRRDGPGR